MSTATVSSRGQSTNLRATNRGTAKNHVSPRRRAANIGFSIVAVIIFIAFAFPVYWMVNSSFLPGSLIRGATPTFFPGPGKFTVGNYIDAVTPQPDATSFLTSLVNSLEVTFFTLIITLVVAFLASVALGRYSFKGRKVFIVGILVIQMIPGAAMMLTYYRIMDGLNLTENIVGLGLIYIAGTLPFTIWTLRGFVAAVPPDLEEAAMVDGCSRSKAFWRITFPLLAPGLVSTGIFAFIQSWNEYTMALVLMTKPASMTLPIWLRAFQSATRESDWGGLMAGSTLVAIPVIIFFMIIQGRMTGGLVAGAVKG
jgi:N,N'-diacetylchitobiose transport system permease protein